MRTTLHRTALFGDLVAAVFDEAALLSSNPKVIAKMAALAVMQVLRRSKNRAVLWRYRHGTLKRAEHFHGAAN